LLALSISPFALPACGSGDDPPKKTNQLDGTYRPSDPGAIGSISFKGGKDYLYMPNGCASQSCSESGTYSIQGDNLVLEDAKTGESRAIALQVLETTPASGALVQSIHPKDDLTDPGTMLTQPGQQTVNNGQQTVNPGGQTTNTGQNTATSGNQLDGQVSQLLQVITQALMNAQQMNQQNGQNNGGQQQQQPNGGGGGGGQPNAGGQQNNQQQQRPIDCQKDFPTKDTPVGLVAAYWAACPAGP
ncbi:MAG TPA: hypothetical protein VIF62_00275, partial [Labilithrix sp.]